MVINHNTFIAVPMDVTDPQVLKRFLDKLVQQIDIAFSNRGEGGFAKDIVSTATTVSEVVKDINELATKYIKLDGSNKPTNILKYDTPKTFTSPNELVDKNYIDTKLNLTLPAPINSTSGNAEIKLVSDKLDEIINILNSF